MSTSKSAIESESSSADKQQLANLDAQIQGMIAKTANNRQFTRIFLFLTILLAALIVGAPALLGSISLWVQVLLGFLLAVTGTIWLLGLAVTGTYDAQLGGMYKRKDELLQLSGLLSKGSEPSYFDQLVRINVFNLGEYYTLVKGHTHKSFVASLVVAIAGFIFIVAGLSIGFINYESTPPIAYVASGAGVLTEFIAGVFFYLYNKTVRQLKEYHDSLLTVQNILLSFKIIDDIEDNSQRAEMVALMLGNLTAKQALPSSNGAKRNSASMVAE